MELDTVIYSGIAINISLCSTCSCLLFRLHRLFRDEKLAHIGCNRSNMMLNKIILGKGCSFDDSVIDENHIFNLTGNQNILK